MESAKVHKVTQVDMPIVTTQRTHNFGDLTRYMKYNMSAGLIMSTLERMIQDDRMDRMSNNFGMAMKLIGLGIMIFIIFFGAAIAYQVVMGAGGGAAASTAANTAATTTLRG